MMNKLFLVSGVSGSGKSTIMKSLMDNEVVSFTTRIPRVGEVHGKDYIFLSEKEFDYLLINDGLVEYTRYSGNFYGISKEELTYKLAKRDAFCIVDFNGMKQLKALYENCVSIFIHCEKDDVETNMRNRKDTEENIFKRLKTYDEESLNMVYYDHVVINRMNELVETIEAVSDIIGGFQ